MRIGAVNYLNSKPLVYGLPELAPNSQLLFDLPSRLADSLAAGRLDVALIPSVELFRGPGYVIVSDACVACRGPVLSVKLHFRVPPKNVRTVALDEGSRTSAALTQILLAELCGVRPSWEPLPIGSGAASTSADAVLLIGDRAIAKEREAKGRQNLRPAALIPPSVVTSNFAESWDLGETWCNWTGLPLVFATWTARRDNDSGPVAAARAATRDRGVLHLDEIAAAEAPPLGIGIDVATRYFRENLHFTLGPPERRPASFSRFVRRAPLAPAGRELTFENCFSDGCTQK